MKAKTPILRYAQSWTGYKVWVDNNADLWYACHNQLVKYVPEVKKAKKIRLHIETNNRGKLLDPAVLPLLESELDCELQPFYGKKCKAWVEIVEWL